MENGTLILCVDDDPDFLNILEKKTLAYLGGQGIRFKGIESPIEALEFVGEHRQELAVIIADYQMPEMDGVEFIRALPANLPAQNVILSGNIDERLLREALQINIFEFIDKQDGLDVILEAISSAFGFYRRRQGTKQKLLNFNLDKSAGTAGTENLAGNFHGIIGQSEPYLELVKSIKKIAPSSASCLLVGPSGSGKEMIARAVHNESGRSGKFVAVNCAALPADLIESELFGHKKGSFTGADADKVGLIEHSSEGTLFLDEIGEMPIDLQAKLLRVLQEKEVLPIGEKTARSVDLRVVSATNVDLDEAIGAGKFREDLYYRLNVVSIDVPTLNARAEDIEPLTSYFLSALAGVEKRPVPMVSEEAMKLLKGYTWPGNVRELQNMIHRLVLFCDSEITAKDLPKEVQLGIAVNPNETDEELSLRTKERDAIVAALSRTGGKKEKAAELLGISRATIYRKLKEYNLD